MLQIAGDGGLLSKPVTRTKIPFHPAERIDLVLDFSERIDHVTGDLARLEDARDALQADRARRIVTVAERQVVRRDRDRQPLALGAAGALELVRRQLEDLREILDAARGGAELRVPVTRAWVGGLRAEERLG